MTLQEFWDRLREYAIKDFAEAGYDPDQNASKLAYHHGAIKYEINKVTFDKEKHLVIFEGEEED